MAKKKKKNMDFFSEFNDTADLKYQPSMSATGSSKATEKKGKEEPKSAKKNKTEEKAPAGKGNTKKKQSKKDAKNKAKSITQMKSTQIFSPIREVRDGIIITKDGRFVKVLEFSSINFLLRNSEEKDSIIAEYMAVIKLLPDNVQFKVLSKKADTSKFVDKIRKDMETEPNMHCRQLQREQIQQINIMGNRQAVTRRFLVSYEYVNPDTTKHLEWETISSALNTIALRLATAMRRMGNELISDDSDAYTLEMLYGIMCRSQSEKMNFKDRLRDTIVRYLIDSGADTAKRYVPVNDLISPQYIDTKHHKYLVIDGIYYAFAYIPSAAYPHTAVAGWTSLFSNLGEGVDVDIYLQKLEASSVRMKLGYAIKANKIRLKNTEDTSLDYEEQYSTVSSGYYLKDGLSAGEDFCYMSTIITITGHSESELRDKCDEIKEFCASVDIPIKMANYRHEQAFLSTLPICKEDQNLFKKSKRNILSRDFASTYPFSSFEVSDENGIFLGINQSNNSMVFIDNFDATRYVNPNMVFLGTTGAGKTYTLQCVALRMRQRKIQTFIIAPIKGHEFKRACDTIGGSYIKIATGSKQNINIMGIRKMDHSTALILDGEETVETQLAQKISQIHTFFSLMIPDISHEEKQLLDEALINTYKKYGITFENDSLWDPENPGHYRKMPILGDLYEELIKEGENINRIATILKRFVTGSASSFNRRTNVDLENPYIVLDLSSLSDELLPLGMFIALDYVWDKTKEDRTKKKAIFIDEVWQLLGPTATDKSAKFVLDIFKLIRGYGGCAVAATQDLNDFFSYKDGIYGKAVIYNSKIKFVMRLEAKAAETAKEVLDLTDAEVDECPRFDPGQGILIADTSHVIVQVEASKHENDIITTRLSELAELREQKLRNRS